MNDLSLLIPFLIYQVSFTKTCTDNKGALLYLKELGYHEIVKFLEKYERKFEWEPSIHKFYPYYGMLIPSVYYFKFFFFLN
jgi:hypothetical protein